MDWLRKKWRERCCKESKKNLVALQKAVIVVSSEIERPEDLYRVLAGHFEVYPAREFTLDACLRRLYKLRRISIRTTPNAKNIKNIVLRMCYNASHDLICKEFVIRKKK